MSLQLSLPAHQRCRHVPAAMLISLTPVSGGRIECLHLLHLPDPSYQLSNLAS